MDGRRTAVVAATIALAAMATGCQSVPLTRAGVPLAPTVLRLETPDAPGRFTDEVVGEFAEQVARESGGTIEIELQRLPDDHSRWNQEAAQLMMDGGAELAIIPAQAWDAFDVRTFSALYIPFAVTSDELIDAISENPMAEDMLAGLDPLHVTGLALVPGGVRHTFRAQVPFVTLDSYIGEGVRVSYSKTVWNYFEALGARPMDPNGSAGQPLIDSGELTGFDAMFRFADSLLDEPATTADTASQPHALTIVGSESALAALPEVQRDALHRAAVATVAWSIATRPTDGEQARLMCERAPGAVVSVAGADVRKALRTASLPIAEQLLADPVVAGFAARIAELDKQLGHPQPTIVPCTGPVLESSTPAPPNEPERFPQGEYRRLVTTEELSAAGLDGTTIEEHKGLWILNARDGVLHGYGCPGTRYEIVDERFTVFMGEKGSECGSAAGKILFSAGWQRNGDQLTFTAVESGSGSELLIRTLIGGGPWTKVG